MRRSWGSKTGHGIVVMLEGRGGGIEPSTDSEFLARRNVKVIQKPCAPRVLFSTVRKALDRA